LPLPPGVKTGLNRGQPKSGLPLLNGDKTRGSVETGANERRGGSPSKMGATETGGGETLLLVLKRGQTEATEKERRG